MKDKVLEATQKYLSELFKSIGEDSTREGLRHSARRISEANEFLYNGYFTNPAETLDSVFNKSCCSEMIVVKNIEFYSMCEHHMLPFFGKISIGYVPYKKIVGISNFAKLVDVFARRLQIQESLTMQIADTIMDTIKPKGVMVVCEALHLCMAMRGVQKQDSTIITSAVRGLFREDSKTRAEFMQLLK